MKSATAFTAIMLALLSLTLPASAHSRHHYQHRHHRHYAPTGIVVGLGIGLKHMMDSANRAQIVEHPGGCPHRAFCGCAAAVKIFGYAKRDLWLAANWFRFPPASPAPGMVAVRRHHVFVILDNYGDGTVLAYDGNSGGHQTRIHRVRLAGYSVRNPRD